MGDSSITIIVGRISMGVLSSALLTLGALAPTEISLVCLTALSLVLILGWPSLVYASPSNAPRVVMSVVFLVALGISIWGTPAYMSFALAFGVMITFIAEMLRRDGRTKLVEHASATLVGAILCATIPLWNFTWNTQLGVSIAIVCASAICVVAIIESIETPAAHVVAFINGIVVGCIVAWAFDLQIWAGLIIGACVALCYVITSRVVIDSPRPLPILAAVARSIVPAAMMSAVVYVLSKALV